MIATRVGYAGGSTQDPTYYDIADHTEAIEIVYDGGRLSIDTLLELFWQGHDPTRPAFKDQYRKALFAENQEQLALFERSVARQQARLGQTISTELIYRAPFYAAEDDHQKWFLRRHPQLFAEIVAHYPTEDHAVLSTAAARLNGYLGGSGNPDQLERDIDRMGLSEGGRSYLRKSTGGGRGPTELMMLAAFGGSYYDDEPYSC